MKRLSVDDVMEMGPCRSYSERRVRELFGDSETLSLIEVLGLDIPAEDRLWVMFQNGVIEDDVLQRFANVIADRAVRNHALTYEPTREWAEAWLSGEDRSKEAARAAIERAAVEAWAAWAAWAAVVAAKWAVAAATDASDSAATERELQVEDLRRLLLEAEA